MQDPPMQDPRVSILLPAHNAERTLAACLRSILRQSEPRWECVVVERGTAVFRRWSSGSVG